MSIEFFLLTLIIIFFIFTTTKPLIESTKTIIEDTYRIIQVDSETKRIINTINEVDSFGEGTTRLLQIVLPEDSSIEIKEVTSNNWGITFSSEIKGKPFPLKCPNGVCTKTYFLNKTLSPLDITSSGVSNIQIKKAASIINVDKIN